MLVKNLIDKLSRLNVHSAGARVLVAANGQIQPKANFGQLIKPPEAVTVMSKAQFSSSAVRRDLMEFFDDKKNWTELKVKHGREWRIDELRLKSNVDLHKLWYVLHKERNMLLTMEEIYVQKGIPMPSHERIAKVDESMQNLLDVVEERNVAYNLLETGETKIPVPYRRYNSFGYIQYYRPREYLVPWYMNKLWKLKYHYKKIPFWSKQFRTLNRVRLRKERQKIYNRVHAFTKTSVKKHGDVCDDEQYVREYFEKKFNYKAPLPYHELIRKPKPTDLPKRFKERLNSNGKKFYDEEF